MSLSRQKYIQKKKTSTHEKMSKSPPQQQAKQRETWHSKLEKAVQKANIDPENPKNLKDVIETIRLNARTSRAMRRQLAEFSNSSPTKNASRGRLLNGGVSNTTSNTSTSAAAFWGLANAFRYNTGARQKNSNSPNNAPTPPSKK
jgi:hypothetical protein